MKFEAKTSNNAIQQIETQYGRIILLGTAHVSQESVEDVKNAVQEFTPDRICVELDSNRYKTLTNDQSWKKLDIYQIIRENKVFLLITSLVLSAYQKRIGSEFGIRPGEEMRTAIRVAEERGTPLSNIDRDITVTLTRAWRKTRFWGKIKLLSVLLGSAFSKEQISEDELTALKQGSAIDDMMGELAKFLPTVKEVLISERDEYLALGIWQLIMKEGQNSAKNGRDNTTILAVVGAGHVPGMLKHLKSYNTASMDNRSPSETGAPSGAGTVNKPSKTDDGEAAELGMSDEVRQQGEASEARQQGEVEVGEATPSKRLKELALVPPRKFLGKVVPWLFVIIIATILVSGFVFNGWEGGLQRLLYWVLINGGLSALGSIIALAHPLTILASVLSAPITSMNPTIGVGMVTGLLESFLRKPRVQDFESLNEDATGIKGFYRNRITRILLVFLLSSVGSAIGTFVALPLILP